MVSAANLPDVCGLHIGAARDTPGSDSLTISDEFGIELLLTLMYDDCRAN